MALPTIPKPSKNRTYYNPEKMARLASKGLSQKTIASALGISLKAFLYSLEADPVLRKLYLQSRANGEVVYTDRLDELSSDGDFKATSFILKCRFNWTDTQHIEVKQVEKKSIDSFYGDAVTEVIDRKRAIDSGEDESNEESNKDSDLEAIKERSDSQDSDLDKDIDDLNEVDQEFFDKVALSLSKS